MGKVFLPHVSPETTIPSTTAPETMRRADEDAGEAEAAADWVVGGPVGSKGAVLVFRSCVLASRTPSMESTAKSVGNNTGTNILLNKAKNMAKRLVAEPHPFNVRPKNIMHDVMETFGGGQSQKYAGQAYVVRHASEEEVPDDGGRGTEEGGGPAEHRRDIEDVLNDLNKITLKTHRDIENTTANIQPQDTPQNKDSKDEKKHKKTKVKSKRKIQRSTSPATASDDSEQALVKPVDSIKVLESSLMPARALRLTYKLVNTETKLLHRLLQAHGLQEAAPDARDFALLWAGLHPKPDVLRSLGPNQRVNHFPRSYELTRKDKLFKNIEKMQYFRGFKNFDFIPTTFLMPGEYKELCSAHHRTKGPWIVKPAASSRGRGIYIVNTPEQIPSGESVVVAKYIDRPLLVGGHKCDLRLYVCLAAADPLLLYLYEEGLVRLAAVKYDRADAHLWNPCMHLCNYSINKYHTDYVKCDDPNAGNIGHKWTLSALLRHLRKQGRDTGALMAAIEDLVVKSILSSAHTIAAAARVFVPGPFNCFELFGYDILIDEMLKPWLLEINLSPSLACESPLDARVKSALLADTLTLVGLPAAPAPPVDPARAHHPRLRIGAAGAGGGGAGGGAGAGLTGEELRLVRAVRAQYARRGGFVRIFPSQNSWQKYSQYLDPVSGIPVCSTSLNNGGGYAVVQHNYNLLVHTHVLPHFRHAAALSDTPERLKRYEAVSIAGAAPPVQLGEGTRSSPARDPRDPRHAKELIKRQLADGLRLTPGEGRRLFGLYLTHVLKRLAGAGELAAQHAGLVLRFLRRACSSLRMPYQVQGPPPKMCDKDRCAVIAKQLNDFLYMYYRETDLYTDSEDKSGCVPNIHFAQFLSSASEADLEDVLLVVLRHDQYVATFLGDGRAGALCVDVPPARRPAPPAPPPRHTLLRLLAALTHVNCRRYRPEPAPEPSPAESAPGGPPAALLSNVVVKDSLKEEKPLTLALKYAKS